MNAIEFLQQKEAVEVITGHIQTSAIYCFGKQKTAYSSSKTLFLNKGEEKEHIHLYLLVLVKETIENATSDISDKIKTKTQGCMTATLLIHHVRNLKNHCDDQQFFFWQIMQNAELLFQDQEHPPYLDITEPPKRNLKATSLYVENRKAIVETIWNWVYNDDDVNSSIELKMFGLHQVVEQECLSLIRVFMGYAPNHFALDYLFSLCSYFSTITTDFFPNSTKDEQILFKQLRAQSSSLRFCKFNDVDYLNLEIAEKRCQNFKVQAGVLIALELKRLNQIEIENLNNQEPLK